MNVRIPVKAVAFALAIAVPLSGTAIAQASEPAPSVELSQGQSSNNPALGPKLTEQDEAEFEHVLSLIEQIPEDVVSQGDDAIKEWFVNHSSNTSFRANPAECTFAITKFVASNALNFLKILKIKRLLKEAGGVKKVVDDIAREGWSIDNIERVGGPLFKLVKEFFGIAEIEEKCFD